MMKLLQYTSKERGKKEEKGFGAKQKSKFPNLWLFNWQRLLILKSLFECEDCLGGCELRDQFWRKKPIMSYHLALLKKHGFVKEKKTGRSKIYFLNSQKRKLVQQIVKAVFQQ